MPDTFQNRFLQAQQIRGIKWIDIANCSGLDKAQISQYKNGVHEPEQDALYKLATALRVNVAWLMGHDVPMEIDRKNLEKELEVCELVEQCYGSKAYELLKMFIKLNDTGKEKALENMSDLIQLSKYTESEKRDSEKMA